MKAFYDDQVPLELEEVLSNESRTSSNSITAASKSKLQTEFDKDRNDEELENELEHKDDSSESEHELLQYTQKTPEKEKSALLVENRKARNEKEDEVLQESQDQEALFYFTQQHTESEKFDSDAQFLTQG